MSRIGKLPVAVPSGVDVTLSDSTVVVKGPKGQLQQRILSVVAVSIDGVLAPLEGGASPTEVRAVAAARGRISKGPAGYREIGCATLAFCDERGDLISVRGQLVQRQTTQGMSATYRLTMASLIERPKS